MVFVAPLGMSKVALPMTTTLAFAFAFLCLAVNATMRLATTCSVIDRVTDPAHPPLPALQWITTCAPWMLAVRCEIEGLAGGGGGGGDGDGAGAAAGLTGAMTVRLLNGAIPYWMSPP